MAEIIQNSNYNCIYMLETHNVRVFIKYGRNYITHTEMIKWENVPELS